MPGRIGYHRPAGLPGRGDDRKRYERRPPRREDKRFYASQRWRETRGAFLAAHPLCEQCAAGGRTTPAAHVHHREGRKDRPDLALEWSNLQALCASCHATHATFGRPSPPRGEGG